MTLKTINEKIDATVNSGITPLKLKYDEMRFFENNNKILRSYLVIESLDLGVLEFDQYRYVCRRSKKTDELTKKQIQKVFEDYDNLMKDTTIECISIPVTPRMLLDGTLADYLFKSFAKYPTISPHTICIDISADILFEEIDVVKKRLNDLKDIGVKISIFELGDEFCPMFRLSELNFDYGFVDSHIKDSMQSLDNDRVARSLINFLHLINVKIFILGSKDDDFLRLAEKFEFDGYGSNEPYTKTERRGDQN